LTALYENRSEARMAVEFRVCHEVRSKLEDDCSILPLTQTIEEYNRRYFDDEFALQEQLAAHTAAVRSPYRDDTVHGLYPMSGMMGWVNEIFGGKNEWFNNRPPYPHPIVHDISKLDGLRPDFASADLFNRALEQIRYFTRETNGRIPLHSLDLQSTIDSASLLIDYTQLVYMLMDHGPRMHSFLRMLTETLIRAFRMIREEMPDGSSLGPFPWWLPGGVFLGDDLMAVLSPDLYAEFAKPYAEMIAAEFGGIALHSCGAIKHNLENVASIKGMLALNTHETVQTCAPVINNRIVLICGGFENVMAPNYPGSPRDLLKTGEEVAEYWWNDFNLLPKYGNIRLLYQCHALLHPRSGCSATEIHERLKQNPQF
jgi:hypothetical protein